MKQKNTLLLVIVLLFFIQVFGAAADESPWVQKKNVSGIEVYVRDVTGSKYKEFRGIMYVKNVTLGNILSVFDDIPGYTKWLHECIEAKLVKRISIFDRYIYTCTRAPWPVWDRDMAFHAVITQDPQTLIVTIRLTGTPDMVEKRENIKRIRVPKMICVWTFKPMDNGDVMLVYQMHSEAGGDVPASIANMAVVDLPYNTLKKLKDAIKDPKYIKGHYDQIKEPKKK
jgi:hypothetical protein